MKIFGINWNIVKIQEFNSAARSGAGLFSYVMIKVTRISMT